MIFNKMKTKKIEDNVNYYNNFIRIITRFLKDNPEVDIDLESIFNK